MPKIRFTKSELKIQKDALGRFRRYLPTLMLKKQQLQMEIHKLDQKKQEISEKIEMLEKDIKQWVSVFGEDYDFTKIMSIGDYQIEEGNIAGIEIPLFKSISIEIAEYDLFQTPLWIDRAVKALKELLSLKAEIKMLNVQRKLLSNELRITSQRVNLFEKVKIPEAREIIRIIKIYLGDQQTAAVVRGKISKNKIKRIV